LEILEDICEVARDVARGKLLFEMVLALNTSFYRSPEHIRSFTVSKNGLFGRIVQAQEDLITQQRLATCKSLSTPSRRVIGKLRNNLKFYVDSFTTVDSRTID
jgi:hypothetical protein